MQAGKLRHLVSLQGKTRAQDESSGAVSETWAEEAEVWAAIEPLSVREFIASQATQSAVTTRVTIRYRPGVDATKRFVYRGAIYNIQGVLPDKVSGLEYLTLACSEGVGDGGA